MLANKSLADKIVRQKRECSVTSEDRILNGRRLAVTMDRYRPICQQSDLFIDCVTVSGVRSWGKKPRITLLRRPAKKHHHLENTIATARHFLYYNVSFNLT